MIDMASNVIHNTRQCNNREYTERVKLAINSIIKYFQNIHKVFLYA